METNDIWTTLLFGSACVFMFDEERENSDHFTREEVIRII